jgi:hypothetical protein
MQPCRDLVLAELAAADGSPKIYPIEPPAGSCLVCVWHVDDKTFVGTHGEFSELSPGYRTNVRVIYFTVLRDLVPAALTR